MSNKKGFTLIEIILFIIVFTLGVVGIMVLFYNTLGKTSDPLIRERGIQVAQAVMDEILAKKWDEKVPNGGCKNNSGVCGDPSQSSIGPDSGENSIDRYDDVDDYVDTGSEYKKTKTWQSSDFGLTSGFSVKITVSYADVNPTTGEITENTSSKTSYKLITVEVDAGNINEQYRLIAIKADF